MATSAVYGFSPPACRVAVDQAEDGESSEPLTLDMVTPMAVSSARQSGHRAKQVFISGVRVDRGGQYRLVAGKALREADVLGPAVDGRAGRVAQDVEAHVAVESRASLPHSEAVAYLPGG